MSALVILCSPRRHCLLLPTFPSASKAITSDTDDRIRHAGSGPSPGLIPLLHFLGNNPDLDVFPDRPMERQAAADSHLDFLLYTLGGPIVMLVSLITVYQYVPEHVSLMSAMSEVSGKIPKDHQGWAFLGFPIGFGVKMPIFPFHGGCHWRMSKRPTAQHLAIRHICSEWELTVYCG